MLADDLALGAITQIGGIVLAAGYDEIEEDGQQVGYVFFEVSRDKARSKAPFADGNTRKRIAPSDKQQPAIVCSAKDRILVTVMRGSGSYTYLSADFGETWKCLGAD